MLWEAICFKNTIFRAWTTVTTKIYMQVPLNLSSTQTQIFPTPYFTTNSVAFIAFIAFRQ